MYRAEEYTYRVFWSKDDQEYVGTVVEFPSLSHLDTNQEKAFKGIVDLMRFVLKDMEQSGEHIPEPLSTRTYSGKYALRMTPEQHRRVALEAAEAGVSINQLLVSRV